MNFAEVSALTIPEGVVLRILKGDEVLWSKNTALLPAEYQQVKYIATDGNQYIDTGVLASEHSDGIKYVFKGNVTAYQSTSVIYWFGALASGCRSGNFYTNAASTIGLFAGGSGNYGFQSTSLRPVVGSDFELIVQGTALDVASFVVTIDGTQLSKVGTLVNTAMPAASIYLFTAKGTSAATTANRKYYGKLYSFTMDKPDGTPIRNYVPCYRKSDNAAGLYDTVTGAFFTNAGSGSFTVGPDV